MSAQQPGVDLSELFCTKVFIKFFPVEEPVYVWLHFRMETEHWSPTTIYDKTVMVSYEPKTDRSDSGAREKFVEFYHPDHGFTLTVDIGEEGKSFLDVQVSRICHSVLQNVYK